MTFLHFLMEQTVKVKKLYSSPTTFKAELESYFCGLKRRHSRGKRECNSATHDLVEIELSP